MVKVKKRGQESNSKANRKGGVKKLKTKKKANPLKQQKIDTLLKRLPHQTSGLLSSQKKKVSAKSGKTPARRKQVVPERYHESIDEDGFRTVQIKANKTKGWKPAKLPTLQFVEKILRSVASLQVTRVANSARGEQQHILADLNKLILQKLKGVKVPSSKNCDYSSMKKQARDMEEEKIRKANKYSNLEKSIERYQKLVQEAEERVNEYEKFDDNCKMGNDKLHPLLQQDYQCQLDLQPLPEASTRLPLYTF